MMSREKENTINSGSVKCIYNHWETLNEGERAASLNNIVKKLTTNDSHYLQSIKQEYYLLIRERTGEKIIFFSFFIVMVLFSNHNLHNHSNINSSGTWAGSELSEKLCSDASKTFFKTCFTPKS